MEKDCKAYHKDRHYGPQLSHKDRYYSPQESPRNNFVGRNHELLCMNNVECFKCHNIGHMARDCNLTWDLTQARTMQKKKVTQVWKASLTTVQGMVTGSYSSMEYPREMIFIKRMNVNIAQQRFHRHPFTSSFCNNDQGSQGST